MYIYGYSIWINIFISRMTSREAWNEAFFFEKRDFFIFRQVQFYASSEKNVWIFFDGIYENEPVKNVKN